MAIARYSYGIPNDLERKKERERGNGEGRGQKELSRVCRKMKQILLAKARFFFKHLFKARIRYKSISL